MKKKLVIILLAAASYGLVNAQNITGTGTTGTIPKFTGTSTEGNSQIIDNGTTIGIGGGTIPATNSPKLYSYGPGAYFDIPNNASYQGNNKAMFKINRPSTSFENFLSFCEAGANKWTIGMDDDATGNFNFFNTSGRAITIGTNKNLGLGLGSSATPSDRLTVIGNGLFMQTDALSSSSSAYIVGLNGYSDGGSPDYTWMGDLNTGMLHPNADNIGFTTNGTERVRITSNGYVGIGTVSPLAAFQSVGNFALFSTTSLQQRQQ